MHLISKNIENLLFRLAQLLPQVQCHSVEKHKVMGSEILSWNTIEEIDGESIKPEKEYTWKYPVIFPANHKRRLFKRYRKNGIPGIQEYLEWIISLQKEGEEIERLQVLKQTLIELSEEN